jgi:hypothetical protein
MIVLLIISIIGISEAAPSRIVGANIDDTPPGPVPACSTFGFSIDATNTLPVGQNNAIMVRVDHSGITTVGYVITSQATGYTVYVFDMATMVVIGSTVNTITGYVNLGRLQGDVGSDGKLYVFNTVSSVNLSCPAGVSPCLMLSRWNGVTLEAGGIVDAVNRTDTIDDARESGANFLMVGSPGSGNREFRVYSKATLIFSGIGTLTGVSAYGHIGRTIDGHMYGGLASSANPNVWTFIMDSPTANNSVQVLFTAGKLLSAIFPIDSSTDLFAFDSDRTGGTTAQRAWIQNTTIVVQGPTDFSGGAADIQASYQGGFYDTLNNRVFSLRTDGAGSGQAQRTIPGVAGFTTQENFICGVQCNNSGGTNTGTQIVDYSQTYARMYVGSSESPARLTRIKVCAIGGP